jgi:hypothetical protein
MFELLFLAFLFIFGGIFILKFLFFFLGLLFSGIGLFIKIILTVVVAVLLFSLGATLLGATLLGVLFSGGFILLLLGFISIGALVS